MGSRLQFATDEISNEATVVFLFLEETSGLVRNNITLVGAFVNRLWEWIHSLVIRRVVLLSLSCNVPNLISPGVQRCGPGAEVLKTEVVDSSADAEEARFTPVVSPGIAHKPVLVAILFSPAND